tara:strand:+ start:1668 stop:2249 length:582 start_codon:yes stop_codon:yes gene_type:complete
MAATMTTLNETMNNGPWDITTLTQLNQLITKDYIELVGETMKQDEDEFEDSFNERYNSEVDYICLVTATKLVDTMKQTMEIIKYVTEKGDEFGLDVPTDPHKLIRLYTYFYLDEKKADRNAALGWDSDAREEVKKEIAEKQQKEMRQKAEEMLLGCKELTENVRGYIKTLSVEDQEEIDSILDKIIDIQSKYK